MDDPTGGLVKLGEKTLGSIEKGVTSLIKPWTTRREGQAGLELRKKELLMLEQTRQDIEDVRLGKKTINERFEIVPLNPIPDERLTFPSAEEWEKSSNVAFGHLASFATKEKTLQDMEQAINLRQIAMRVEEELQDVGDEEVSENPVDRDWFTKWRTYAQDTSSEQLQNLWAKLLVSENRKPGSCSLHTLELLSRLSKEDAKVITEIFGYAFGHALPIFEKFEPTYKQNGITFNHFLHLEALGILNGVSTTSFGGLGVSVKKQDGLLSELYECKGFSIYVSGESEQTPHIVCYSLSQVGKEISPLTLVENTEDKMSEIATYVVDQVEPYKGSINVQIVRIVGRTDKGLSLNIVKDVYKNSERIS